MINTNTRAERSQAELQQALLTAARNISLAIQEVTTLGNFDGLVDALGYLNTFAQLTEKHRDIVDAQALAFAVAHTDLILDVYRTCQGEARDQLDDKATEEYKRIWAQTLPTGAALREQIEAEGEGAQWEGLTFWKAEDDDGYWSVTNAYGIDNVAWVRTTKDFQRLINQLRANDGDIGPTPPMCEDYPDDYNSTWGLDIVFYDAAKVILSRPSGDSHLVCF